MPAQNVSQSIVTFNKDDANIQQALRIHWNIADENFVFSTKIEDLSTANLGVLNDICTMFEPIGLLVPSIFKAKLLLQSIWILKIGWDDKL